LLLAFDPSTDVDMNPSVILSFIYAPLSSVDIEENVFKSGNRRLNMY